MAWGSGTFGPFGPWPELGVSPCLAWPAPLEDIRVPSQTDFSFFLSFILSPSAWLVRAGVPGSHAELGLLDWESDVCVLGSVAEFWGSRGKLPSEFRLRSLRKEGKCPHHPPTGCQHSRPDRVNQSCQVLDTPAEQSSVGERTAAQSGDFQSARPEADQTSVL